jgi:hypothetical protein
VAGSQFKANGLVHSESAVTVKGSGGTFTGGVEYATSLTVDDKSTVADPAPAKTSAASGMPASPTLEDYRPGGTISNSGVPYIEVPKSQCIDGIWRPRPGLDGVVFVPCSVVIDTSGNYPATIAAEGKITVNASKTSIGQSAATRKGQPSLVSGAKGEAVVVTAADVTLNGQVVAGKGTVRSNGARATFTCGAIGTAISVMGANSSAIMAASCLRR